MSAYSVMFTVLTWVELILDLSGWAVKAIVFIRKYIA